MAQAVTFPGEWEEQQADGDAEWWLQTKYTSLSLDCNEAIFISTAVGQSCPTTRVKKVSRIQNRGWWRRYQGNCVDVAMKCGKVAPTRPAWH